MKEFLDSWNKELGHENIKNPISKKQEVSSKKCVICAVIFKSVSKNERYCSIDCKNKSTKDKYYKNKCICCDKIFESKIMAEAYCSTDCRSRGANIWSYKNKAISYTNRCIICNKMFESKTEDDKYCSADCRGKGVKNRHYKKEYINYNNKCIVCDKIFKSKTKDDKYCSVSCINKSLSVRYYTTKCISCGEIFKSKSEDGEYCSTDCMTKGMQSRCLECGKMFKTYKNLKSKFCDEKCEEAYGYKIKCYNCNKIFDSKNRFEKFCSENCMSEYTKSDQHGYYKKDLTNHLSEDIKYKVNLLIDGAKNQISHIDGWLIGDNLFRINKPKVLERDNHKCYICAKSSALEVHHITPRSWGGGHDMDNLISLCTSCHRHIETRNKDHAYRKCLINAKINGNDVDYRSMKKANLEKAPQYCKGVLEDIFNKLSRGYNNEVLIEIANAIDEIDRIF